MQTLRDAISASRFVEIPDGCSKKNALILLATCLAAAVGGDTDTLVSEVLERELGFNSSIGDGLAVPHLRGGSAKDAPLLAAAGWSRRGIDYHAQDKKAVHLVVMFYIPDARKDDYLREMRGLVSAVLYANGISAIAAAADLTAVQGIVGRW